MTRIVKVGRKWAVEGDSEGWVFKKKFPTKWKAEVALEVFKKGGRVSDYWKAARERPPPKKVPWKAQERVLRAFDEIEVLKPTPEEIEEYGKEPCYGVVTYTDDKGYFPPRLRNTWGLKRGGRVHIDIGSGGVHLMLDKDAAQGFIEFIKTKRKSKK